MPGFAYRSFSNIKKTCNLFHEIVLVKNLLMLIFFFVQGPVSASDLTTRERLNRPHVKCYQRHPGTQLKEAQHIIEGNHGLDASLEAIDRNIGMLKITEDQLKSDISDKQTAAYIDSSIVRHRRRQANHRWVVGGLSC